MIQPGVRDGLERRLRWLFGTAAATFGLLSAGVVLALFDAPGSLVSLRPGALAWAPFAVAYTATAAVLAWRVARAPRRETSSMILLGAGLGLSGVAALAVPLVRTATDPQGKMLAAGAAADLLAGGLFVAAWLRLWLDAVPGEARQRRDESLLVALLDALVPEGGAVPFGAADPRVRDAILSSRSVRRSEVALRFELRALDVACLLLARESFRTASPDTRSEVLARLCRTRVAPLRRAAVAWREAALTSFYADPRVLDAIGFDRGYLDRRLTEGPNRDAHRERLAVSGPADAPAALEKPAAEGPGPSAPVLRLVRGAGPGAP